MFPLLIIDNEKNPNLDFLDEFHIIIIIMDWSTIFLFCVLFGDSSCSVVVVSTGEKFDAPTMKLGWDIFVLQGRVIESVPEDGCDELENHQDVMNNIVLINPCEYRNFMIVSHSSRLFSQGIASLRKRWKWPNERAPREPS